MDPALARSCMQQALDLKDEAALFLMDLIRAKSVVLNEAEAQDKALSRLRRLGLAPWLAPIPEGLKADPEYTFAAQDLVYDGSRGNVLCKIPGAGHGQSLIVQSHLDVVPAEPDWQEAFRPTRDRDWVAGRGACDAQGQVVTILLCLEILKSLNLRLAGDLMIQWVIEEEVGGNGALAAIREGHRADGVVVLEPTDLQIHPANRGAIWFRVTTTGKSVHMGRIAEGVSAIEKAIEAIRLLKDYEKGLVAQSKGIPLFERYDRPVQLNVGLIAGGLLPSMVPGECTLEGGVGFLPNKSMTHIKEELQQVLMSAEDPWLRDHVRLEFPKLHNDSYETDPGHPMVLSLREATRDCGLSSEVFGWNVSCDARLYSRIGGMPTVVFGPGSIARAHSREEGIDLGSICQAAGALTRFIVDWCGLAR